MSRNPWYPFFWSDYSGKTMHLTQGQHGAYMLFLRWVYTTGKPVPFKQCYSIARAVLEQERSDADVVLAEFFGKEKDGWHNRKAESVIKTANEAHTRRVEAGRIGGQQCSSIAKAMPKQPEPEPYSTILTERDSDTVTCSKKNRSNKKEQSRPTRWAENDSVPNGWVLQGEANRAHHGLPQIDLWVEAEKFVNYWVGKSGKDATKKNWYRTWCNWVLNAKGPSNGHAGTGRTSRLDNTIAGAFQNLDADRGPTAGAAGFGSARGKAIESAVIDFPRGLQAYSKGNQGTDHTTSDSAGGNLPFANDQPSPSGAEISDILRGLRPLDGK